MTHIRQKTCSPKHVLSSLLLGAAILVGSMGCAGADESAAGSVSVKELYTSLGQDKTSRVLDVRTLREYDTGHIASAVNVPLKKLGSRLDKVDAEKSQEIYVVAGTPESTVEAVKLLEAEGFTKITEVAGGMPAWSAKRYPVEK